MKKAFFIAIALLPRIQDYAQGCDNLIYFRANTEYVYDITGNKTGSVIECQYRTNKIDQSGKWKVAHVNAIFKLNGAQAANFSGNIMCDGNVIRLDAKLFAGDADQDFKDSYVEYPLNMSVGQSLQDGKFTTTISSGGKAATMVIDIVERKVTGKEKITVPAGTFDCFVISSVYDAGFLENGKKKTASRSEHTSWVAPGFGMVKGESARGKIELVSVEKK